MERNAGHGCRNDRYQRVTRGGYCWSHNGPLPILEDHSRAKHDVLRDYLVNYLRILAVTPRSEGIRVTLVDGFAGGGLYQALSGEVVGGSPLVLLQALQEARALVPQDRAARGLRAPYVIDVKLHLVEANESTHAFLRQVLAEHPLAQAHNTTIELHHGTFEATLPAILADIKQRQRRGGRSVFVLDQYGWSKVDLRSVRAIFDALPSAEVFLTWMVDSLINFLSEQMVDKLDIALGKVGFGPHISADRLLSYRESATDEGARLWRRVIQSLLADELRAAAGAAFRTPFYIVPRESRRGYWLLHLAQHLRANEEMKRIHWANNNLDHPGGAGLNMLGYVGNNGQLTFNNRFDRHAHTLTIQSLMDDVPRWLGDQRGPVRFGDLVAMTANETPAIRAQVQEAVFDLARQRDLSLRTVSGASRKGPAGLADDDIIELSQQLWLLSPRAT